MSSILQILAEDGKCTTKEVAIRLGIEEADADEKIKQYETDHVILGYHAVVDWTKAGAQHCFAFIEVCATPERGHGFDRLAGHIAAFDEVHSIHLVSGTHDLNVVVEGQDFRDVALFVAEKLALLEGVRSTSTSFVLKSYKLEGRMIDDGQEDRRLAVAP